MPTAVSRRSRTLDAASVALILVGAVCYIWAYMQMDALRAAPHDPKAPIFAGYTRFVRLMQLSYAGLGMIGVGILVGIGAAIHARRRKSNPNSRSL